MRQAAWWMWMVAAALAMAAPSFGQSGSMSMSIFNDEGTFSPELSRGDLEVFKRVLSLKDDEVRAMEDLYGAYCNTLKEEGVEVRTFVAKAVEESEVMADQRLLDPAQKRLAEWGKRSTQLKTTFMADLKSLLTRDQEARWPIVERELRRIKGLRWGRVPGEQPDLVKMVEELPGGAARATVMGDLLERYSQDMDRAIVARTQFMDKHSEGFRALTTSDPAEAKKLFEQATRVREGVAGVNDRYLREICAELPGDAAQELRDRYFKECYPLLSKGTRGERYVTAAGKLKTLTPEQRAQVDVVLAEYDRDRRALVARMAEVIRDQKLNELPEDLEKALNPPAPGAPSEEHVNSWARGVPEGHPLFALRRSRFELDRATRTKLEAILTPDQRAEIPDQAAEPVVYYNDSPWGL
jgi:hypothetical protein